MILIYLKAVETEDSLFVRYWDDSANSEIYQYPVNITNTADEDKGTFLNRLEPIHPVNPGIFELDDGAYIVNAKGVHEGFQKDVAKVDGVRGKHTSGLYNYQYAEISQDGKTLTLHYNLNKEQLKPYYVADFGLPVEISFNDLGQNVTAVRVDQPTNGTAKVENGKIIYQPDKAYSGTVVLSVTATFGNKDEQLYNVGIYPATTVYYEETFIDGYTNGTQPAQQSLAYGNGSDYSGKYNYGYDSAYNTVGNSNGTVATLNTGEQGMFTFTGTGVDVYARTDKDSGKVMIYVYSGSGDNMTLKRLVTVDTRHIGDQSANGTAYNVPIMSLTGLDYGEYTLRILATTTKTDEGKQSYPVYIDGFRVHGTLADQGNDVYVADNEANPTFVELRNAVLAYAQVNTNDSQYADQIAKNTMSQVYATDEVGEGAVVIVPSEQGAVTNPGDILNNGPKNELYLRSGEAVVFKINGNYTNVQVGLKALNASVNYTINNEEKTLSTSTDMFYTVTPDSNGVVTIRNNGEGILSITEVKVIGASASGASVFAALTANDLMPALLSMGFEAEPVEATATLNITVQCGDKAVPVTLTADGMTGETHTFTAAEIKAVVENALPDGYTVEGVTFTDVTVAYGDSGDASFTATQPQTPDVPDSFIGKVIATVKWAINKIIGWFR